MFKIPSKPPNLPKYPYDIQNAIENDQNIPKMPKLAKIPIENSQMTKMSNAQTTPDIHK